ncbi:hypothetical protein BJV82DRAFT_614116 [Fennellomyces sp. T-0311]|nr:hypothetical protein BJV82DRAFT_614116 [Fennellomyces sp. T-0311]
MTQSNISYSHPSCSTVFYDADQIMFNSLIQAIAYILLYLILRTILLYFQQAHRVTDTYTKLTRRLCIRKSPSAVDAQMRNSIILIASYTSKRIPWLLIFWSTFTQSKNLIANAKLYFRPKAIRALESKEQPIVQYKKPAVYWPPRKDDDISELVQRTLPSDLFCRWKKHEIFMENYAKSFAGQPSKRRRKLMHDREPQQIYNDSLTLQGDSDSVTDSRYKLYLLARDVLSYYENEYGYQQGTPEAERIVFLRKGISDFTS